VSSGTLNVAQPSTNRIQLVATCRMYGLGLRGMKLAVNLRAVYVSAQVRRALP